MSKSAITRSLTGCLTCKKRKKKCDETRPVCTRCKNAEFECLGYDHIAIPKGPRKRIRKEKATVTDRFDRARDSPIPLLDSSSITTPHGLPAHHCHRALGSHESPVITPLQSNYIFQTPRIHALDVDHVIQMFLFYSQPIPTSAQPFRSVPFSIIHAIADQAKHSALKLKSTYVGARIKKAISDGAGLTVGLRLIDDFQSEITTTTLTPDMNAADIASLLDCLFGLALGLMHIVNTPMAYSLLRKSVPFLLAMATKFPELWADYLSISIRHTLAHPRLEFSHFAFLDTVTASLFGVIPLIHYDTTLSPIVPWPKEHHIEWAHGCSPVVIILLARVNSWRAARYIAPMHPAPTPEERREFQSYLQQWNPTIEYGDHPTTVMGRLAVQESWKHAVLIYMHMGMCGANSADPRVEASVRQVAQLAATIEADHPLEIHMTIPCIIAAAAARREKHRAILRKKVLLSKNERINLVRGADFVLVLDHLWHGAAAGGQPTTWQDYVNSRLAELPIEM